MAQWQLCRTKRAFVTPARTTALDGVSGTDDVATMASHNLPTVANDGKPPNFVSID